MSALDKSVNTRKEGLGRAALPALRIVKQRRGILTGPEGEHPSPPSAPTYLPTSPPLHFFLALTLNLIPTLALTLALTLTLTLTLTFTLTLTLTLTPTPTPT